MPVFNNRAGTGSVYGNNGFGFSNGTYGNNWNNTAVPQTTNNWAWGGGYQNDGYSQQQLDANHYQYYDYVSGRAGADAYQMPPNVNKVILYDNDDNRMYVKGYDNNGRPRVLADSDIMPHVDPEPQSVPQLDLSAYATKDDLERLLNSFVEKMHKENLSIYATREDLDKALSGLSVGNGGRIVRSNESNA